MCVVSAITDNIGKQWPNLLPPLPGVFPGDYVLPILPTPLPKPAPYPHVPNVPQPMDVEEYRKALKLTPTPPVPEEGRLPTAEEIKAFLALIEAAKKFDEIANQPHCEDPQKAKIIDAMEQRLAALEAAAARIEAKLAKSHVITVEPNLKIEMVTK